MPFYPFRRPLSAADPLGNTTHFEYGPLLWNSGSKARLAGPTVIVTPEGRRTEVAYDPLLRRRAVTAGAGTPDAATTAFAYDPVGNLACVTNANGQVWSFAYDARNRRVSAADPLGNTWGWSFDTEGNQTAEIRPDGGVTTNIHDAMQQIISSTDPAGHTTTFGYDPGGRLVSLTDARSSTHGFEYDGRDRRTAMIYPDGSVEEWTYDPAGNVAAYTTRAGQVLSYTYDNRNREVSADWSDATPDVARAYDAVGRLTLVSNAASVVSFGYDAVGRLASETSRIAGSAVDRALGYGYDADGLRNALTYPDGFLVQYGHTARGQVASVTADGPPPLAAFAYDPAGNRIAKALENGRTTAYAYDAASRLTQVAHDGVITLDYALNAVGNRTSRGESIPGGGSFTDAYGYDAIDQLTGVSYGAGRQVGYQYDPLGNRQQVTDSANGTTTYTANNLNQYTTISGEPAPTHDPNGNLTGRAGWVYTYDAQNRLVEADGTLAGARLRMTFAYDGLNRCVGRKLFTWDGAAWQTAWEKYLSYDGWSLVAEFDDSGADAARYVHGPVIDEILARIDAAGTLFYHHDGLGSTVALTDETGAVVERYRYDVFGKPEILDASGASVPFSAFDNPFLFTGREWLADVGLYDYRHRIFDSNLGRFLQADPIRFWTGDLNLYRYVKNDVPDFIDPFGLCEKKKEKPDEKKNKIVEVIYDLFKRIGDAGKALAKDKTGAGPTAGAAASRALGGAVGTAVGVAKPQTAAAIWNHSHPIADGKKRAGRRP